MSSETTNLHIPRPKRIREYLTKPSQRFDRYYHGSRLRLLLICAGAALVLFFICFLIVDDILMPRATRHGSEFALPDIVGSRVADAERLLAENQLRLQVTSQEYNPAFPEGTVLSQYPIAGTMVKEDRSIKVVASLGKKDVIVPELRGVSVRQARLDIEGVGLKLGEISWAYTDTLPENMVLFSFPPKGEKVPIGASINLMVNKGRGQGLVYMPNVIGQPLDDAVALLKKLGLVVGKIKRVSNENYLPETVLEQSFDPDTELETGDAVNLVVSKTD